MLNRGHSAAVQGSVQGEAGNMVTVKLHVNPEAAPRFFKPRSVPSALKGKAEEEQECLQKFGIIEPVQFSRWAAPIVLVLKEDKTARICWDYKLIVNQVCKLEEYPLPRIEDLFATLAGVSFSRRT